MTPSFVVAIPSHRRSKTIRERAYPFLKEAALLTRTTVFINADERESYEDDAVALEPQLCVHRCPPEVKGLAAVYGYIDEYYPKGTRVVYCHDDVKGLWSVETQRCEKKSVQPVFERGFQVMASAGASLGGFYPVQNRAWAMTNPEILLGLTYIYDPLHLEITGHGVRLRSALKADYERSLAHYERDGAVLRMNRWSVGTRNRPWRRGSTIKRTCEEEIAASEELRGRFPALIRSIRKLKTGAVTLKFCSGLRENPAQATRLAEALCART